MTLEQLRDILWGPTCPRTVLSWYSLLEKARDGVDAPVAVPYLIGHSPYPDADALVLAYQADRLRKYPTSYGCPEWSHVLRETEQVACLRVGRQVNLSGEIRYRIEMLIGIYRSDTPTVLRWDRCWVDAAVGRHRQDLVLVDLEHLSSKTGIPINRDAYQGALVDTGDEP